MKGFLKNTWKNRAHVVLALPAFLVLLLFAYMPMFGLIIAFKQFDYTKGILASPWNFPNNFRLLIVNKDKFLTITKNTVMYYAIFTIVGTFLNIVLAISIDQFAFKNTGRVMQTIMIIPVFISYAAVSFVVYAFFSKSPAGIINGTILPLFGGEGKNFYQKGSYWPWILTIVNVWHGVGYGSVLYMSVLAGIDQELYEAAKIDGANKWQQIWNITIPMLIPMITVMLLLSVGNIMRSDTGLFYTVTRNIANLHAKTQTIDAFVLNQLLNNPNYGLTAATTFFQSVIGLAMMLLSNGIVRKLAPQNSLF